MTNEERNHVLHHFEDVKAACANLAARCADNVIKGNAETGFNLALALRFMQDKLDGFDRCMYSMEPIMPEAENEFGPNPPTKKEPVN